MILFAGVALAAMGAIPAAVVAQAVGATHVVLVAHPIGTALLAVPAAGMAPIVRSTEQAFPVAAAIRVAVATLDALAGSARSHQGDDQEEDQASAHLSLRFAFRTNSRGDLRARGEDGT
jgi:hypothetical protein